MSDWPLRKLGDDEVCLLNPKKREVAKVEDGTPVSFVPMARVDDVSGTMDVSEVKSIGEVRKGYTYFAEGDVVFAKITPCMENGKSAIARNLMNGIGFGTTEFHVLRSGQLTTPEWLHLFVRNREFREEAKKNMHGAAGQQRVPVDFLREATIPLPPVDEQRRIVARIEELTRRAEEALKLRQEALEEVGNTVTAFIDQLLYDLPRSCWKPIETYAKLQGGYAFKSEWFSEGGMRLLRNQNIYHDEIDWSNDKTVFLPNAMVHEFERFALLEGDIVLTMDRPLIKSGLKASRIRQKDLPCLLLQRVGRFLCSDEINKDYLFQCLLSQVFTSQISGSERSNAVPHISSKQVEGISIPIPPLAVQLEVVEKTEKFREKLNLLCSLQNETSNDLEAFQSALLAKAFRGEL